MKATLLLRLSLAWVIGFAACVLQAADKIPGKEWEVAASPEQLGWSSSGLEAAKAYSRTINTAAVVVVHKGQIVAAWGEIERPFNCHSMRKSILSALFGVHVASGKIDLDKTLEELGIDDKEPSLSEIERKATVRDLLKARSGIYHPALYETASMKAARPKRHSHKPGEFWYYNNWDFNALGTIFEQQTASSIFEEFEKQLAGPLGMQDFIRSEHTEYVTGPDSVHPAYPIILSARDLARFGLLFARGGRWGDQQLIPEEWVKESTTSYSEAGIRGGYGYMWWVAKDGVHYPGGLVPSGSFSARGAGGHCMLVVPAADLVIVHRVDTFKRNNSVEAEEQGKLIHLILAAAPDEVKALPTKDSDKQSNRLHEATFPVAADAAEYDLLFVNGRIMDGTGNPWFAGDVAVRDGKIAAVGRLDRKKATRVIDLAGRVIAPGFIDLHSHADRGLESEDARRRAAPNLVTQGITTVVVNPDGFGPPSIKGQIEAYKKLGVGPNVAMMIGHGGIRSAVMGSDHRRPATKEEIEAMRKLLRDALDLGAFGMSAGLEYVPGRWATTDEIKALVAELAKGDHLYSMHERSSGADPFWYLPSRDGTVNLTMIDNIVELIDVAQSTGAKVVATHIKARGKHFWGSSRVMINLINEARARGVRIFADQYPYNTSGTDGNLVLVPEWLPRRVTVKTSGADAEPSPAEILEAALKDEKIVADLERDIQHEMIRRGGPENIFIMDHPDKSLIGLTLAEAAAKKSITPLEMVYELQLKGDRKRRGGARLRSYSMSEIDMEAFAAQPWVATCTDAGIALPTDSPATHPRYYGAFPRKIRKYAIENGNLTVEDAVRASTSLPAQILGIRDRGLIREGMHADLVVFDLKRIRDAATAADPHQYSEGVDYVLVGGTFVVEDGKLTWALPGNVLRPER